MRGFHAHRPNSGGTDVAMPGINPEQNGRLATSLPKGPWKIAWLTSAPDPVAPSPKSQLQGAQRLWGLSQDGLRFLDVPLPAPLSVKGWGDHARPLVGFDHQVILPLEDRVLCVSTLGKTLWELPREPAKRFWKGALVTSDDRVLLGQGEKVLAIDPQGKPEVLASFPGETVQTAPVLTQAGDLLVGTDKRVLCLRAK